MIDWDTVKDLRDQFFECWLDVRVKQKAANKAAEEFREAHKAMGELRSEFEKIVFADMAAIEKEEEAAKTAHIQDLKIEINGKDVLNG